MSKATFDAALPGYPPPGSRVRYLGAKRFDLRRQSMAGRVGTVLRNYPADPDEPEDAGFVGVQFSHSPYADGTMALDLADEHTVWERIA